MSYSIIVHNKQGAASGHSGETQGEINRWLNGWSDPENLSGTVKDETGDIVGVKEIGKKRIQWYTKNEAAVSLGRKGGLVKSPRKAGTSAENGKLGGRPKSKDKYSERHGKYPNTVIISYPFRWGGQLADRWMWLAELNGEVLDYDSKRGLIADAIKKNLPYVVLRVHRNGNATNIACSGQVAGAGKSDGESTPSATCH